VPHAHPFVFTNKKRDKTRKVRPHEVIDTLPSQLVVEGLRPLGYELGETRINYPLPGGQQVDPMQLARVDTSDCRPKDVIVTTTRLPLSDPLRDFKKYLQRAYTDLEQELLEVWQAFLPELARARVRLNPRYHQLLPAGREDRFDMRFRQEQGARYLTLQRFEDKRRPYKGDVLRTAVFLLCLPRLPRRTCGYVGAWGLDGVATLVWAHLLRRRHADLLRAPVFVMAELVGGPIPERPTDYRWVEEWQAEVLLRVPLGDPPRESQPASPASRTSRRAA
jgi:hypothetical protein